VDRSRGETRGAEETVFTDRVISIRVVDESPDGTWRLVIHVEEFGLGPRKKDVRPERDMLGYVDFAPDGRYEENLTIRRPDLAAFLPALPADSAEAMTGWRKPDRTGYADMEYDLIGTDPRDHFLLAVRQVETGYRTVVYASRYEAVTLFDTALGLPVYREVVFERAYGRSRTGFVVTVLDTIEYLDAIALDSFAAEAESWVDAYAKWDMLTGVKRSGTSPRRGELAGVDLESADSLHIEADSVLSRAARELTFPELLHAAEQEIASYRVYVERTKQPSAARNGLVGEPAPEWELADLDGSVHRLSDYRGTVVVLDFWYRGCPWCIKAMPQLKKLRERFGDKSLTLFGVNVDKDIEDARFVADKLELNYPTLLSEETQKAYGVTGYPTIIIIDLAGGVADIHRGYADDLEEELAGTIEFLIGED
jgi:peroxiredoxin